MRSLVLTVLLVLPWVQYSPLPAIAAPAFAPLPSQYVPSPPCAKGYHCRDVAVQLCVKRSAGGNIWTVTRKDVLLRRGTSTSECTKYAVGIGFPLQYNGKRAAIVKRSLECVVQAQHRVKVTVRKCYSVVQKNKHGGITGLIAGARVCVRGASYRGPGCHDDFAINVYAYPNGRLTADTFVGFKLQVANL